MKIRKAKIEEAVEIARIEKLCFSVPWSEKALSDTMQREDSLFLAAYEDGSLVGYVGSYFCLPEGYITNVAVSPDYRRRGIGRALVEELIAEGKSLSLEFLTLEVRESNSAAIALYSSLGFERVGRRPRFYSMPEEAAILMTYYFDAQKH